MRVGVESVMWKVSTASILGGLLDIVCSRFSALSLSPCTDLGHLGIQSIRSMAVLVSFEKCSSRLALRICLFFITAFWDGVNPCQSVYLSARQIKLMFHYVAHNNTQFHHISNCRIARGVAIVTVRSVVISGNVKLSHAASESNVS
jgi:hypothetical protein